MSLDLIGCASVAFPSLVCDVKGHPEGLLMRLPIRLNTQKDQSKKVKMIKQWGASWRGLGVARVLPRGG